MSIDKVATVKPLKTLAWPSLARGDSECGLPSQ